MTLWTPAQAIKASIQYVIEQCERHLFSGAWTFALSPLTSQQIIDGVVQHFVQYGWDVDYGPLAANGGYDLWTFTPAAPSAVPVLLFGGP